MQKTTKFCIFWQKENDCNERKSIFIAKKQKKKRTKPFRQHYEENIFLKKKHVLVTHVHTKYEQISFFCSFFGKIRFFSYFVAITKLFSLLYFFVFFHKVTIFLKKTIRLPHVSTEN